MFHSKLIYLLLSLLLTSGALGFTTKISSAFPSLSTGVVGYDSNKIRTSFPFAAIRDNRDESLSTFDETYSETATNSDDSNTIGTVKPYTKRKSQMLQERKRDWINRSLTYYSTVSREAKRRENGQYVPSEMELDQYKSNFITAKKLYFARHKIKNNQPRHAERIYRKLIDDLLREQEEDGSCDHAQIAISTLLLALLLQRQGEVKETRATFVRFFRLVTTSSDGMKECTCSAKVLQAFSLFEMKQNNVKKAYALAQIAVKLDPELVPVLNWKQFRDAKALIKNGSKRKN